MQGKALKNGFEYRFFGQKEFSHPAFDISFPNSRRRCFEDEMGQFLSIVRVGRNGINQSLSRFHGTFFRAAGFELLLQEIGRV